MAVKLIYQAFANLLSWMVLRARSDTATGQRVHRRPDLPSAVHRGNGRGPCPSNIPRPATRADLHLHARSRPRIPDSRAVLHGAAGRIPHGGGALQTAPILIAVLTAFLTMEGIKYLLAGRQHPGEGRPGKTTPPSGRLGDD